MKTLEQAAEEAEAVLDESGLIYIAMLVSQDCTECELIFKDGNIDRMKGLKIAINHAMDHHISGSCKCHSSRTKWRFH